MKIRGTAVVSAVAEVMTVVVMAMIGGDGDNNIGGSARGGDGRMCVRTHGIPLNEETVNSGGVSSGRGADSWCDGDDGWWW
jgi:hypothetical protein